MDHHVYYRIFEDQSLSLVMTIDLFLLHSSIGDYHAS